MNCFSGLTLLTCLLACVSCGSPASGTDTPFREREYDVHYTITVHNTDGSVDVAMRVSQARHLLREVSFAFDDDLVSQIAADAGLTVKAGIARWLPPASGGELRWHVEPTQTRGGKGYDALLTPSWGIFRAEDVIPRARTRTLKGARARTTMEFELPRDWTAISEYSSVDSPIDVTSETRRFAQPSGWIALGDLGIRRETIAGTRVAIAAPQGHAVRRMDMLALLNWTLPELAAIAPQSLPRLTIVSAGDPMWRGGLSAPASIFIHADRPLISENATSTLLHEIVHVAFDIDAADGFDWIVEGLAEYYSLELLQRGAAITPRRYRRALEDQREWAKDAKQLCGRASSGATTALAVVRFRALDNELREQTGGKVSLDSLVTLLANDTEKATLATLREQAEQVLGKPASALKIEKLPGCKEFAAEDEG
tara:strand:+ start:6298 stop:7575 length:1278 start_codon:yes stop_codon:yes gene_type:complete